MNVVKIFIADDHRIFREGFTEVLAKRGRYEIVGEASNGREAVSKIPDVKPDIVFLDISMPEMNGIEALTQIRKIYPSAKIIMLSMHDKGTYVFQALGKGASGYLLKDTEAEEIYRAIDTAMAGGVHLSDKINQQVIKDYIDIAGEKNITSPLDTLTNREREIFQLVAEGHSGKEIAGKLNISPKTVEHHRSKVMSKLSCQNIAQIIRLAIKEGVIES